VRSITLRGVLAAEKAVAATSASKSAPTTIMAVAMSVFMAIPPASKRPRAATVMTPMSPHSEYTAYAIDQFFHMEMKPRSS
jgi:hypothetical protein